MFAATLCNGVYAEENPAALTCWDIEEFVNKTTLESLIFNNEINTLFPLPQITDGEGIEVCWRDNGCEGPSCGAALGKLLAEIAVAEKGDSEKIGKIMKFASEIIKQFTSDHLKFYTTGCKFYNSFIEGPSADPDYKKIIDDRQVKTVPPKLEELRKKENACKSSQNISAVSEPISQVKKKEIPPDEKPAGTEQNSAAENKKPTDIAHNEQIRLLYIMQKWNEQNLKDVEESNKSIVQSCLIILALFLLMLFLIFIQRGGIKEMYYNDFEKLELKIEELRVMFLDDKRNRLLEEAKGLQNKISSLLKTETKLSDKEKESSKIIYEEIRKAKDLVDDGRTSALREAEKKITDCNNKVSDLEDQIRTRLSEQRVYSAVISAVIEKTGGEVKNPDERQGIALPETAKKPDGTQEPASGEPDTKPEEYPPSNAPAENDGKPDEEKPSAPGEPDTKPEAFQKPDSDSLTIKQLNEIKERLSSVETRLTALETPKDDEKIIFAAIVKMEKNNLSYKWENFRKTQIYNLFKEFNKDDSEIKTCYDKADTIVKLFAKYETIPMRYNEILAPFKEYHSKLQMLGTVSKYLAGEIEKLPEPEKERERLLKWSYVLTGFENPTESKKILEFKVERWIREQFLEIADKILCKYHQTKSDIKDALEDLRRDVTELLKKGKIKPIEIVIGETPFDPQIHISHSTGRDNSLPNEVITGVIRYGFKHGERIIQQPVVTVNKR